MQIVSKRWGERGLPVDVSIHSSLFCIFTSFAYSLLCMSLDLYGLFFNTSKHANNKKKWKEMHFKSNQMCNIFLTIKR